MLIEKGIPPFAKWEKELPKILFDHRFKVKGREVWSGCATVCCPSVSHPTQIRIRIRIRIRFGVRVGVGFGFGNECEEGVGSSNALMMTETGKV